jgi:CDP-glucose 4,6-dehydratase
VRPWQHVLEPVFGYLKLAEHLWQNKELAGAYNFGPVSSDTVSVKEIVSVAQQMSGSGKIHFNDRNQGLHEAGFLALDTAKARFALAHVPRWSTVKAIEQTIKWYKAQVEGENAHVLCLRDLTEFQEAE